MLHTYSFVDLHAFQQAEEEPVDFVDLQPGQVWVVPQSPPAMDAPVEFIHARMGDKVRIPLLSCVCPQETASIAGMFMQLGIKVRDALGVPVPQIHLSLGVPSLTEADGKLRIMLGIALRIAPEDLDEYRRLHHG